MKVRLVYSRLGQQGIWPGRSPPIGCISLLHIQALAKQSASFNCDFWPVHFITVWGLINITLYRILCYDKALAVIV